jgi:hypothetical protein
MTSPLLGDELEALAATLADMRKGTGQLYFHRTERKLVLAPDIAADLQGVVAARLPAEAWVPGRTRARIHSVYCDTPDFALYHRSKETEAPLNLKVRLRAYSDATGCFLETKVGTLSPTGRRLKHKARLALTDGEMAAILGVTGTPADVVPASRRKFWTPLLASMTAQAIQPRLTVSYVRTAYVGDQVRITFDEGLTASVVGDRATSPLDHPLGTLADRRIVEIKFLETMPGWLIASLDRLGLPLAGQPFSKYKTAVPMLFANQA